MRLAILVVLTVVAASAAPAAAATKWSADGRWVAETDDERGRVVLLRADGRRARTLARTRSFVWAPHGDTYVFWRDSAFWVADADGGAPQRVVRGVYNHSVAWSPRGTRFAYVTRSGVNVIRRDGRGVERLPVCRDCAGGVVELAWSPTGRQLALATVEAAGATKWGANVIVSNVDGSGDRVVVSDAETVEGLSWSADGAWLGVSVSEWYGPSYARVVAAASSRETSYAGYLFTWAPRGARLALTLTGLRGGELLPRALRLVRAPADRGVRIPNVAEHSWAPDGRRLVVAWRAWISVVRADGRGRRRLTPGHAPAWSPSGARVAFTRGSGRRRSLCVLRLGEREATPVCVPSPVARAS